MNETQLNQIETIRSNIVKMRKNLLEMLGENSSVSREILKSVNGLNSALFSVVDLQEVAKHSGEMFFRQRIEAVLVGEYEETFSITYQYVDACGNLKIENLIEGPEDESKKRETLYNDAENLSVELTWTKARLNPYEEENENSAKLGIFEELVNHFRYHNE